MAEWKPPRVEMLAQSDAAQAKNADMAEFTRCGQRFGPDSAG